MRLSRRVSADWRTTMKKLLALLVLLAFPACLDPSAAP